LCEDSADNKQGDVLAPQPEQQARSNIDRLLQAAGWHVCDASAANIHAARGVAIREFPLPGYGFADYLIYIDGKAAGVIEAMLDAVVAALTGMEFMAGHGQEVGGGDGLGTIVLPRPIANPIDAVLRWPGC
jgi:hypothetical protein